MASTYTTARKIWQSLSAIKTGVLLLIVVVIVSAAGTVILQPLIRPEESVVQDGIPELEPSYVMVSAWEGVKNTPVTLATPPTWPEVGLIATDALGLAGYVECSNPAWSDILRHLERCHDRLGPQNPPTDAGTDGRKGNRRLVAQRPFAGQLVAAESASIAYLYTLSTQHRGVRSH